MPNALRIDSLAQDIGVAVASDVNIQVVQIESQLL